MHWLLTVHFGEDYCRIANKVVRQNLNMRRKFVLSLIKCYKQSTGFKRAVSQIMFDCLLDPAAALVVLGEN